MSKMYNQNIDYVSLIRKGQDDEAIDLLYKKVLPEVKTYVQRNSGSLDDAMDVFQEGIVLLYRKVLKSEAAERTENIPGYLFQICVNEWIRRAKKNQRYDLIEDDKKFDKAILSELDATSVWLNKEDVIDTAFQGLSQKCIELLTLSVFSEISQEDIMHRMDLGSVGAVKMQYKRCKKKLIENINDNPTIIKMLKGFGG